MQLILPLHLKQQLLGDASVLAKVILTILTYILCLELQACSAQGHMIFDRVQTATVVVDKAAPQDHPL